MTPLELADWLKSESHSWNSDKEAKYRAAAAALRSLVAERDEAIEKCRRGTEALCSLHRKACAEWRRKVAYYISKARWWMVEARHGRAT